MKRVQHVEDLEEIIGKPPSWIVKNGTSVILISLFIVLFNIGFLNYTQVLVMPFTIKCYNNVGIVKTKRAGNLFLKVSEDKMVNPGDTLAYVLKEGDINDLLFLSNVIRRPKLSQKVLKDPKLINLGTVQLLYESCYKALKEKNSKAYLKKINELSCKLDTLLSNSILVAPNGGIVRFLSFSDNKQYIQEGYEIFYIQESGSDFYGEIKISQNNRQQVIEGKRVNISFDVLSNDDFLIQGKVVKISSIPDKDGFFSAKIEFLNLNKNQSILLNHRLKGKAEIFVENKSFFSSIYRGLVAKSKS